MTSEDGREYVEAPDSDVPTHYRTTSTSQSFSETVDADCPLCQLLGISFTKYFKKHPKRPMGMEGIMIKELKYRWEGGLRSLQVDFCTARQGYNDEHHIEFPIETFSGRVATSLL